jgi:ribonuclease Z
MKPLFQPQLVNGAEGDPVVYVDHLFEGRAMLFDLGEIQSLPARKLLRLSHVFVSHTHMDHFIGFDHLVRVCLGRALALEMYGPPGFVDQVAHRLGGYTWNLVENYDTDFTLIVAEVDEGPGRRARFRCRHRFEREDLEPRTFPDGVLVDEEAFRVRAAVLDHSIPCLGLALEEKNHINIWKNRLDELGLPTGPWLQALKSAVRRGAPDDTPFTVGWQDRDGEHQREFALGELRERVLRVVPGQKIAYVVDTVYHEANARRIVALARDADILFIETVFLERDADRAARTRHLTAAQAGRLARAAGAKRAVPMHFSARYSDDFDVLVKEFEEAVGNG